MAVDSCNNLVERLVVMGHACNPNYLGDWAREITSSSLPGWIAGSCLKNVNEKKLEQVKKVKIAF